MKSIPIILHSILLIISICYNSNIQSNIKKKNDLKYFLKYYFHCES